MGFFSWKTMDTDTSIPSQYSNRKTFRVQMLDNKGNVWTEDSYEGYGNFGGKDFYELLAEMNGFVSQKGLTYEVDGEAYTDEARGFGINLAFKDNPNGIATKGVLYPNLIEQADGWVYNESGPDNCEYQGYFYDETDYDDDDEDSDDEDNY
jgi:hypothetical protein